MGYPVLEVAEVAGLRGHHHRVSGRDHVWMSLGIGHRALGDPRQPGRGAPRDLWQDQVRGRVKVLQNSTQTNFKPLRSPPSSPTRLSTCSRTWGRRRGCGPAMRSACRARPTKVWSSRALSNTTCRQSTSRDWGLSRTMALMARLTLALPRDLQRVGRPWVNNTCTSWKANGIRLRELVLCHYSESQSYSEFYSEIR